MRDAEDLVPADAVRSTQEAAAAQEEPGGLSRLLLELARAPEEDLAASWQGTLRPGDVVGRYRIRGEIGRGGFGAVYEAFDPELGRAVALKTLRPGRTRRELTQDWIQKEAEAVARLDHPGIVTVHDVGTCPAGPYLVMELLRGETLQQRLEKGPLPADEALRVAEEMARALAHAHGRGVLHRDLKPANVFLTDDGRVKLLDFGLAHLLGRESGPTGGTPAYMPPEQARGETIDERADVYAAGVILHETLSGHRPEGLGSTSVPRPVRRILDRALTREPGGRPRDGKAWSEDLAVARRELERPRAVRRLAGLVLAGLAAGTVVAGLLVTSRIERHRAGPTPRPDGRVAVAVADFVNQTGEPELDGLSGLLITSLEQSKGLAVLTRSRMFDLARQAGHEALARIDEVVGREVGIRSGVRALLVPTVHRLGATYAVELRGLDPTGDDYLFTLREQAATKDDLLPLIDHLSARIQRELKAFPSSVARPEVKVGVAVTSKLEAHASYFEAVSLLADAWDPRRAQVALRKALAIDPDFALAHLYLTLLSDWGFVADEDAAAHLSAVRRLGDRLPEKERLLLAAFATERPEERRAVNHELVDRFPDDKMVLYFAGRVAVFDGQPDVAWDRFERALALDPAFAPALADVMPLAVGSGRREEALRIARQAVAARPSALTHAFLGVAHAARGEREAARSEVQFARDLAGADNPAVAIAIGRVLAFCGDLSGFEAAVRRWAECSEPACVDVLVEVGLAYLTQGRVQETLRVAARIRDAMPNRAGDAEAIRGAALWVGGDRKAAARVFQAAPPPLRAYGGDVEGARVDARNYPPDSWRQDFLRGIVAWRLGDVEAGTVHIRRGLAKDQNQAQGYFWIGEMNAEAGRHAEAVAALRQFLGTYPHHIGMLWHVFRPFALLQLAKSHEALGQVPAARATLDQLLDEWRRADPDLPLLAEAKVMRKRLAAALDPK